MKSGFLLNVVVWEGTAIFKLFPRKDETLLVGRDALFILDFGFNVVDRVGRLDFEGNGFTRQSLDEDLH